MEENPLGTGAGLILGKFMPPHKGHVLLADFARGYAAELTILVCSLPRDPIPGALRFAWMREMFPDARVLHVTEDLPQAPEEHPDFWPIWRDVVLSRLPRPPEFVFASEAYGVELARILGASFVPVDPAREMRPVSATAVRADPLANWEFLPGCVRPYFVRRVCVFGPESTGKSTLARDLARHFRTVHVSEHARPLLDPRAGRCEESDIGPIARGQIAAEDAMARQANRLLVCDTDPLTTSLWSEFLYGRAPSWLRAEAARRRYDLHLLADIDVPWVDDGTRFLAAHRREFFALCEGALIASGRPYVVLRGDWNARWDTACRAVERLLAKKCLSAAERNNRGPRSAAPGPPPD